MKNFSFGSHIIKFSDKFKTIDFNNKIIYLAPSNHITNELFDFINKNFKPLKIKYIDNYKKSDNIERPISIKEYDYIFLYSPNYYKEIIKDLPKEKLFILYNNHRYFSFLPFNSISVLISKCLQEPYIFNFYFSLKFFIAKKYNVYLSSNEKKLAQLKNKHINQRAFIIGNGPSLRIEDLDALKNEVTFAANKIFLAYEQTNWRPTYYSVEDSYDIAEYYDEVCKLKDSIKLFPLKHLLHHPKIKDGLYYPLIPNKLGEYSFSSDVLNGIYPGYSVTYSLLELALYMGIKEVYFIGMDFDYSFKGEYNNSVIIHQNENNHFHKNYRTKGDKWLAPNPKAQLKALQTAKKYADKNGIKIFNATRGGKLEIFPRVDFDTIKDNR
jgi:hypothetical protein